VHIDFPNRWDVGPYQRAAGGLCGTQTPIPKTGTGVTSVCGYEVLGALRSLGGGGPVQGPEQVRTVGEADRAIRPGPLGSHEDI
jgi:hypothetical protein